MEFVQAAWIEKGTQLGAVPMKWIDEAKQILRWSKCGATTALNRQLEPDDSWNAFPKYKKDKGKDIVSKSRYSWAAFH